jgi:hypothetical protein
MPWIGHVGEDVFGATGYLDALDNRGHLASFVAIFGGSFHKLATS